MKTIRLLVSSFLAGIMISIGGIAYLSIDNQIIDSIMFAIGLITILKYRLSLFTGKVAYLIDINKKLNKLIELLIIWIGNFIGVFTMANIMYFSNKINLIYKAQIISSAKLSNSYSPIFLLSCLCGVLMFLAVESFKQNISGIERLIMVFMPVSIFILSGYEHCIANMFYFSLAKAWNVTSFKYLIVMSIGNAVGSIVFYRLMKIVNK